MVVSDQFPIFRLATLLARQISAPIAARIKVKKVEDGASVQEYSRGHPWFGRGVCMRTARAYRGAELRMKLWSLHMRQPRRLPPLPDSEALHVGADILGEAVVFGLGSAIIIFEVNRQSMKQEAKVLEERSQWVAVQHQLEELRVELRLQQRDLERLHAALSALARPSPPPPSSPPPPPPSPSHAPVPPTCQT